MRHEFGELTQWPGEFWLNADEILTIEEILISYSNIIPKSIKVMWEEAKRKGPSPEGPEIESSDVWFPFDLENMMNEIEKMSREITNDVSL